jgi:hypothetical protein
MINTPLHLYSPEVLVDKGVTFRIFAPRASEVILSGDCVSHELGTDGSLEKDTGWGEDEWK